MQTVPRPLTENKDFTETLFKSVMITLFSKHRYTYSIVELLYKMIQKKKKKKKKGRKRKTYIINMSRRNRRKEIENTCVFRRGASTGILRKHHFFSFYKKSSSKFNLPAHKFIERSRVIS